jgi:hypothetical protein
LERLARDADRLERPCFRALAPSLLGVDEREQPEAADVAVGALRRVGSLDGLQGDLPRLVKVSGEEQGLRQVASTPTLRTSAPA